MPFRAPFVSEITSVPYKLSYKLTHLALAAFNKNLELETGQTSCGPQILDISLSTFFVRILKFGPTFFIRESIIKLALNFLFFFLNSIKIFKIFEWTKILSPVVFVSNNCKSGELVNVHVTSFNQKNLFGFHKSNNEKAA